MDKNHLLEEALELYAMPGAKYELIRHNENLTYCIDEKYLLRIHKPINGLNKVPFYNHVDTFSLHDNEMKFLQHLEKCGVCVQKPVCNIHGNAVTKLSDGTVATMLTWLPGRILTDADLTPKLGAQLGNLLAKIHCAAKEFHADTYVSYDRDLCRRLTELLMNYFQDGKLERNHYYAMADALTMIGTWLKKVEDNFIFVHSDLSLSNLLLTENGLVPIDFSLMGYSSPMLDFGGIYAFGENEDFRKSVVTAYGNATQQKVDLKEIDLCSALNLLLAVILHYESWVNEDWFKEMLPAWCNNVFIPLVEMVQIGS